LGKLEKVGKNFQLWIYLYNVSRSIYIYITYTKLEGWEISGLDFEGMKLSRLEKLGKVGKG
jgi:hypothetical protein